MGRKYDTLLQDPNVEVWKDGSIWQHKTDPNGGTISYVRLSGPTPVEGGVYPAKQEYDWMQHAPSIAIAVLILLAVIGVLSIWSMISGKEIGCTQLLHNGYCFVTLPHRK